MVWLINISYSLIYIWNHNSGVCYRVILHGRENLPTYVILTNTQREWLLSGNWCYLGEKGKKGSRKKRKARAKSPIAERKKAYSRNRKKTRKVLRQGKHYGRCDRRGGLSKFHFILFCFPSSQEKLLKRLNGHSYHQI